MCKKLIYLTTFILVLGLVGSASADLVAHWKFGEGAGNIAVDEVGNVVGNVINATWTEGLFPNSKSALEFNGSNAYVDVVGQDWGTFQQLSIAVWLKFESLPGSWNSIFHEDWTSGGIHFMVRDSGVISFCLVGIGPPYAGGYNSQAVLESGKTYHVIASFDITTGHIQIYINGVLDSEGTSSPTESEMFLRSPFTIGSWNTDRYWDGVLDDLRIYDHVVTEDEIPSIMAGMPVELASQPNPEDEMTDVLLNTVLSWTPGKTANTHDVYLGTVLDNVNDADRSDQQGVLASEGQSATTYGPPGRLDFGQTYYWRIDEVNAPPDSTIFKGDVWSFTTEPFAYPIEDITVTAASSAPGQGPENTVNDSGLDANDLHSAGATDMWLTAKDDPGPAWIQYEFDKVLKLHEMWVWNQNTVMELAIGFGIKDATVEYSADGANWTTLGTTHEFARAPGAPGYAPNTTVDLEGVAAKYVKLTANSNWGGILPQYGLSEVRFFSVPVLAREPNPESGATDVDVLDLSLSWRAGRDAAEHNVSLSTDEQAVIDDTAPVTTVTDASYSPLLDVNSTYYWRVDEVNDTETTTMWQGEIWNFTTPEYLAVDDFEGYTDDDLAGEAIWQAWIDGFNVADNGSQISKVLPPYAEQRTVYGGSQSMPYFYDNNLKFSEAELPLSPAQNWAEHGVTALVLFFHGDPSNTVEQMYVKVNDTKVVYDGDASDVASSRWRRWSIDLADLASLGVDLQNVRKFSIGFGDETTTRAGGSGVVFFDNIGLYGSVPDVVETTLIEDFDSLAVGTNMHDVDGWEGWDGDAQWGARVTDAVAYSGTNSLEIVGGRDDLVPNWPEVTSGTYVLTVMQYVPATTTAGQLYFWAYGPGTVLINCETSKVYVNDLDAATRVEADLLRDQWAELKIVMDFYANGCDFYYNDVLLGSRECTSWDGVDIWPTGELDVIYYDDFRFEPAE